LAVCSQDLARSGAPDCPVCTGQCPVRQADSARTGRSREFADGVRLKFTGLSGVHRTVRCAPDCPVSQRSAAQSARDTWPSQRSEDGTGLSGVHRTVRCANGSQISNGLQRSAAPGKETNRAPDSVRCAPDCPVPPSTEGQDSLPELLSTAPSCLGAIKGAPRRMEEIHKQLLSIPDHPH
jgi:hypothetical protein